VLAQIPPGNKISGIAIRCPSCGRYSDLTVAVPPRKPS
jgi:hypothetical protein